MRRKFTTYQDAKCIFDERNLILDTTEEEFIQIDLSKEKLKCRCKNHSDIPLKYYFTVVKSGRFGCKACRAEKKVKRIDMSIEEKLNFIKQRGYTFVSGDLSRILNPLDLICPEGHECRASINDLMRSNCVCNICNGKFPIGYWTIDKCQGWIDNSEEFVGYKVLDIKEHNRALIKCSNENHPAYWTSWHHIYVEGTICRECYYDNENKKNWTLERAKNLLSKYGLTMVDESLYVSSHRRIPCYDELGFIFMVSIHYLLRGRTKFALWKGNPYAVHNIKLFCKLYRPDYEFISMEYMGGKVEHRWKYIGDALDDTQYDREFNLKFGNFVNANCGHPELSKSKLEAKCESILKKYNIKFKPQKTFDDCRYKNKLRFDFYLVRNGQEICIETDGNQHKYPCKKFGGIEGFIERQKRDEIKNKYCETHRIKLIRIPESEFKHMEEILIKELNLDV